MSGMSARPDDIREQPAVLVLDDEEAILASIKSLFRKFPYKFRFYTSMNLALQQIKMGGVDIVISDLRMNDNNGLEFMKEVVKLAPNAKRILMSGYEDKSIVLLALSNGLINHFMYKPWEDNEFTQLVSKYAESIPLVVSRDDRNILYEFDDIPSPPRFQERLSQMLSDMNAPVSKIVQEIEINPALVARLLRIANSVHIGMRKRVTNIKDAVLFVGLEYIASVVTALEAFQAYSARVPERYVSLLDELSVAAVQRAMLAREISSRWQGLENKYVPHISSLLLDIGLFARICLRPERYDSFMKVAAEPDTTPRQAEAKVFGEVTHERVGGAILDNWNLPPDIGETVRAHHSNNAVRNEVKVVQLAMLLGKSSGGYPFDESIQAMVSQWQTRLGLSDEPKSQQAGASDA